MVDIRIGRVTHYYPRIGVAVIVLSSELQIGDLISIQGHTTDLVQRVTSLEIHHQKLQKASAGLEVALKVEEPVRCGDELFSAIEDEGIELAR